MSRKEDDEMLDKYVEGIRRYKILTREEEQEVSRAARGGDKQARAKLINSNLLFVVKTAHKYKGYGYRLLDVIQEGNVGLLIAADKFDPDKGCRFISMAVWWIEAYITNYVLRYWSMVRIGTTQNQRKLFYRLRSTYNEVSKLGLPPDEETKEIARRLGVLEREVDEMKGRVFARDQSLDIPISDYGGDGWEKTFIEALEDDAESIIDTLLSIQDGEIARARVRDAMGVLNERERQVATSRWADSEKKTLRDLGEGFGLTRERVRQIEAAAAKKLKKVLKTVA